MDIKNTISPLSSFFSQQWLTNWTGRKTIFPFYHTISDEELPYISNLYRLRSVDEFKRDLEYFCKHFTPISIEDVYSRIEPPEAIKNSAFHLSFDDGLKEVYYEIAPILEAMGIPATFFINTDFIDNKNLFYRYKIGLILDNLDKNKGGPISRVQESLKDNSSWQGNLKGSLMLLNYNDQNLINEIAQIVGINFDEWLTKHNPYLTSAQIHDLLKRGFQIGSHSADHPRFKNIGFTEQKLQIEKSFARLETEFNISERIFSFPFGDEGVRAQLFEWMYGEGKCKMSFGVSGIKDDFCPYHMHRIPMDECHVDISTFIKSEYLYFMLKSLFNKNQIKRH